MNHYPWTTNYRKIITPERENKSFPGVRMSPQIGYAILSVSPEIIHIQATQNALSTLYLCINAYVSIIIIIKEKEVMNEREVDGVHGKDQRESIWEGLNRGKGKGK